MRTIVPTAVRGDLLAIAAILTLLSVVTSSSPRCENTSRPMQAIYTCVGFTSAGHFADLIERPSSEDPQLTFVLTDSVLSEIPAEAFENVPVHILELSNVTVKSFGSTAGDASGSEDVLLSGGLEDTLEKLVFRDRSSLPATWASMKNLKKLKILRMFNMVSLQLTADFNALADSLTVVEVLQSSIVRMDEDWLAGVSGLESLVIRGCNLKVFQRSMLPRPAANLWNLDFVGNNLTTLPDDFGEGFPALRFLDLGSNSLSTVSKASLAALIDAPLEAIELGGNPLVCDCAIKHLRAFPSQLLSADCHAPESLRRKLVHTLTDEDLQCDAVDGAR